MDVLCYLDEILKLSNKHFDVPGAEGNIAWLGAALPAGGKPRGDNGAFAVRFGMRQFERLKVVDASFEVPYDINMLGRTLKVRIPDGVKDGVELFEFKNWAAGNIQWTKRSNLDELFSSGGTIPSGEYVEWIDDIVLRAPSFDNLKWVINSNAAPQAAKLKQKMLAVFDDPLVVKHLVKDQGLTLDAIEILKRNFDQTLFNKVVEFVDDVPVILP